jgi:TRAP-type transport system small permease protein
LQTFDAGFVRANQFVAGALLAIMATLVFANVVLRYAFGASLSWVEEISRYMMIWLAWLSIGLAMREGAHIAIDTLHHALPRTSARALRLVVILTLIGFFAAVAWLGWRYAMFAWRQETAVLRLPLGAVYLAIPIGSILMVIHTLLIARRLITHDMTAEEQAKASEMSVL